MGQADGRDEEKPVHAVTLAPFRICRYPVTNAHWEAFRKATGREKLHHTNETAPAASVNWFDAVGYCHWLSEQLPAQVQAAHRSRMRAFRGARRDRTAGLSPWGRKHGHTMPAVGARARKLWRRSRQTATASSICARTFTNGARIGTTRGITRSRRRRSHAGRSMANAGHRAAERGGITSSVPDARPAAVFHRNSATRITAFESPRTCRLSARSRRID